MLKKIVLCSLAASVLASRADTVTIHVSADTGVQQTFPDFNLGGLPFMPVGTTASLMKARGLFRFDLAGKIPAGATINSVLVHINVTFKAAGPGSTFELHRMIVDWTEGNKSGDLTFNGGGAGDVATDGETTWNNRHSPSTAWSAAGASGTADATTTISSSVAVDAVAAYTFPSTPSLIADVHAWLDNPSTNFGWLIKSASEATAQTARRIGSRESQTSAASLEITYTPATAAELRVTDFHLNNGAASIAWTGGRPNYRVQRADTITGPWTFVTDPSTATTATAPLGASSAAFYRIASELP